jgi:hypothetical protein
LHLIKLSYLSDCASHGGNICLAVHLPPRSVSTYQTACRTEPRIAKHILSGNQIVG